MGSPRVEREDQLHPQSHKVGLLPQGAWMSAHGPRPNGLSPGESLWVDEVSRRSGSSVASKPQD